MHRNGGGPATFASTHTHFLLARRVVKATGLDGDAISKVVRPGSMRRWWALPPINAADVMWDGALVDAGNPAAKICSMRASFPPLTEGSRADTRSTGTAVPTTAGGGRATRSLPHGPGGKELARRLVVGANGARLVPSWVIHTVLSREQPHETDSKTFTLLF